MVDVWWGIVQHRGEFDYDFKAYGELFDKVKLTILCSTFTMSTIEEVYLEGRGGGRYQWRNFECRFFLSLAPACMR